MEIALMALARPFMYLVLFAGVTYWLMRFVWWALPASKFKTLIFDKTLPVRRPWLTIGLTWGGLAALIWLLYSMG